MGHIAKACPKRTFGSTRVIGTTNSDVNSPQSDPWIRTLMKSTCTVSQQQGPVYKVNIEVEGVRTRALLDHGAQVSLLRSQLLPVVKEKKGWTLDQCHRRNLKLDQQPVGAEGRSLGATGIVQLRVTVESTGVEQDIPFYVLDSNKPIWSGELANCGVILGTNALSSLGFQIVLPDRSVVEPDGDDTEKPVTTEKPDSLEVGDGDTNTKAENDTKKSVIEKQQVSPEATTTALSDSPSNTNNQASDADTEGTLLKVLLASNLYLGPQQTKVASVQVKGVQPQNTSQVGLLSPHSKLASQCCDFIEELWYGEESLKVLITNWTTEPILIERDQVVGEIEEVSVVNRDDPIWEEQPELVARLSEGGSSHLMERKTQLKEQLQIGDDCTAEDQDTLRQLLLDRHQVFALTDEELGETDLVEHHIEMTEHKPIKVFPRRLPYALRAELEAELDQLLSIGCIEPSCSPYASGLVLVRKKDGRLRVCVCGLSGY